MLTTFFIDVLTWRGQQRALDALLTMLFPSTDRKYRWLYREALVHISNMECRSSILKHAITTREGSSKLIILSCLPPFCLVNLLVQLVEGSSFNGSFSSLWKVSNHHHIWMKLQRHL
jgi:hypothetical protein